jgi:hypothetical protein
MLRRMVSLAEGSVTAVVDIITGDDFRRSLSWNPEKRAKGPLIEVLRFEVPRVWLELLPLLGSICSC